ncbi:MAG: hypothetical protein D6689_07265 [Deltaproteobacteria bacterium]|nr:MAG: hypothetical protein D6689_07265 [Deltaproteobacteria bacterium]
MAAVACVAVACGGGSKTDTTVPDTPAPQGPLPQDIAHEFAPRDYQGVRFTPEALGWPGVPRIKVKGKPKLAKLRGAIARQRKKGKLDTSDVHTLVNLLVDQAAARQKAGDDAGAAQLRTEARDLLGELIAQNGDNAQELTLKRFAAIQFALDEKAGADAFQKVLDKFPESGDATEYRTWIAYARLRAWDNPGAAAAVEGWTADAVASHAAYVLAWVRFRQRDYPAATAAIAKAAETWEGSGKPALLRDAKLILARAGAPVDQALGVVRTILPPDKPVLVALHSYELHQGYVYAGYYERASEVLDQIFDGATPADKVTFRLNQADYLLRLGKPAASADKIRESLELCKAAGEACKPELANALAERTLLMARVYHNAYATSFDERYLKAAKVLYELYLAIEPARPDKQEVTGNYDALKQTEARGDSTMGKHAKDVMNVVITAHGEVMQACYEGVLQWEPQLRGEVKVTIDVAQDGSVSAVATEPAAGKDGLAAVAACLVERIKPWAFPARTVPGLTRLVVPVRYAPKDEASPPDAGDAGAADRGTGGETAGGQAGGSGDAKSGGAQANP